MAHEKLDSLASSGPAPRSSRWRNTGLLLLSVALMACGQSASSPPSTPDPAQLEAEEGILSPLAPQDIAEPRTGGKVIRDPGASGGQAVILPSNHDAVGFKLPGNFTSGRYTVKVRARGEGGSLGWPVVALENGGRRRMSVTTLDTGTYALRGFGEFDLRPNQEMSVSLINDRDDGVAVPTGAVVDSLLIEPVRTPPGPPSRAGGFVFQFGTGGPDRALGTAVDGSGHSYVVGRTTGTFPGQTTAGNSAFLRKVDPRGREVWTRQFGAARVGSSGATSLSSVAVDAGGHVYVAGEVMGALAGQTSAGWEDVFLRKYTPDGREVWTRQFGTAANDALESIGVDAGGHVYVVGVAGGLLPGAPGDDGPAGDAPGSDLTFVRQYTPDGAVGWTRQFTAVGLDPTSGQPLPGGSPQGAGVDPAGNVYVVGSTSVTAPTAPGRPQLSSQTTYVRKYTPDGAQAWTRWFDSPDASAGPLADNFGRGIGVDAGGNSYVVGATRGEGTLPGPDQAGGGANFLAKLGPDGHLVWTRQFGSSGADAFSAVAVSPAGDVFVAGHTGSIFPGQRTAGQEDLVVLKYGADGRALASRQLGSAGWDLPAGLSASADGVFLAGWTDGTFPGQASAGGFDAVLVKLSASLAGVTPPPTVNQPPLVTFRVDNGLGGRSASPYSPSPDAFESDHHITLEAEAWDIDGSVARVEFYRDSTKLGEDTTAPYQLVLGNEGYVVDAPRWYKVSAIAVDRQGATTSSGPASITPLNSSFASPDLRGIDLGAAASSYVNFTLFGPGVGGFTTNGQVTMLDPGTPLVPPVRDPAREALIRSAVSRQGRLELNIPAPNGTYAVYLWVRAEDATPYDLQMEGETVFHFAPQSAGRWERVGPLKVPVRDGVLNVASTGSATANFSAIEYARLPQAGDHPPTVKFTGDLANGSPPAEGRVSVDASDADGKVVRVEFYVRDLFGSSEHRLLPLTKIGEATSAPYSIVWHNTSPSIQEVIAVATDDTGARGTASVTTGPAR